MGATESKTVSLRKIKVGEVSVLRNIYFEFGKAVLQEKSNDELNKLLNMLQQNQAVKVEIGGHTDNVGNNDFNKQLSQARAAAVKTYLVKKGIAANRISAMGYGETKPLASNDDEQEGRELNRRVEFKVTGK
jgi:outer membrane protein OmpA-like peptidoglycan-associated protein